MPLFLTLGANCKSLKFRFFVIRVYYEKIGHLLKPIVLKFRHDLFARLRDIAEKQIPAKLKPIVASPLPNALYNHLMLMGPVLSRVLKDET